MSTSSAPQIPAEHAELLALLETRRAANKDITQVNNALLRAGSPMYFYCTGCGAEIVIQEGYILRSERCPDCLRLRELGLL